MERKGEMKNGFFQFSNNNTNMIEDFKKWEGRPNACSMDICYTKDGRTLLVEMNDAYALGCYGLEKVMYARFISARWSQLLQREDEYRF